MLWVDKHRPKNLKQLTHHPTTTAQLAALAASPSTLPHLLFYGPSGAGKKTRIMCLLKAIFGPGADRLRLDKRTFTTPTKKVLDINMICSNYHIELSPGDAGIHDKYVVQEIIKEMAANRSLNVGTAFTTNNNNNHNSTTGNAADADDSNVNKPIQYKIVVLVEVDKLTRQAQAALRRTMEKYSSTCRLILCCNNQSKVMDAVRSRCLGIRIAAPSIDDICHSLNDVARKEQITLNEDLCLSIAKESSRNLRRAILMLETSRVNAGSKVLSYEQGVQKTDWEVYISQLAAEITKEQTPQRLLATREKLYELLVNCIPASVIIKTLAMELMKNLDDELKHDVLEAAAFYEHRISLGSKDIFHLEAFVAKFMTIYKQYLNDLFA